MEIGVGIICWMRSSQKGVTRSRAIALWVAEKITNPRATTIPHIIILSLLDCKFMTPPLLLRTHAREVVLSVPG